MVAAIAFVIGGCSKNQGTEYLGDWVNAKVNNATLKIERNGENFMIRSTHPMPYVGLQTSNLPATLKEDGLHVNSGWGEQTLVIDQTTGHLTGGGADYKRP